MKAAGKGKPRTKPAANRCADCGSFVGQNFTGFDRDRFSDRGRLFCNSCTIKKEQEKMNYEITLKLNNCITNDPCAICGTRCDPCGLDYVIKTDEPGRRLVCDGCANEHAPDLVQAREAGLKFAEREAEAAASCAKNSTDLQTLNSLVEHLRAALALMKPAISATDADLIF